MGRRKRGPDAGDLFAFALDGARPVVNLSSGWARRKRMLQRGAVGDWSDFDAFVMAEALEACQRRAAMTGYAWHVDHMIPLNRGGKHAWYNIQVIPARLNCWKGDALVLTQPGEWVGMLPGAAPSVIG